MFQLVRKGVGTYQEFASTIGRAIPAAVRSGQTIETLAGMLAFLTRNGLSAAQASTSAARALEAMTHPKTVARLEDMGVKVRDASGEFIPFVDVVRQLASRLEGLPRPERIAVLTDLFKGAGGTIQARRFWDPVIGGFDEFNQRIGEMGGAAGALDAAYAIMFEQPQQQIQLLRNQYDVLKTTIGDEVLPAKLALMRAAMKLLQWWNGLSDGTKKLIVQIALIGSAFSLILGIVLTVTGAFLGLAAILMAVGVPSFAAAIGIIAGLIGVMIALPVIIFLIIKHWGTLSRLGKAAWHAIQDAAGEVWEFLKEVGAWIAGTAPQVWSALTRAGVAA
jgi:hypothetical protein